MIVETSSDRNYACFFCCNTTSKNLASICTECGKSFDIGKLFEGQKLEGYSLIRYVNRGYYGATYYAENRIKKPLAVKLIPIKLYTQHDKSFEEEIQRYRQLGSHSNIAELIDAGTGEIAMDKSILPIYYVVTEWIEGQSFTEFIERKDFAVSEMYGAILDIGSGVERFENQNLWHNDLNSDNILVKKLTAEELETRRSESQYICKIVDLGSAVFRQSEGRKLIDDVKFLGLHINAMSSALLQNPTSFSKEDRFFLDELGKIVSRILDEDPGRSVYKAQTALDEVKALYKQRNMLEQEGPIKLADPFAYSNANEFPTPVEAYINLLFSDQFPWLKNIITPEIQPMLITGPRGSGKTMILQSMRLKTRLNRQEVDESPQQISNRIMSDQMVGFFVSARIDIGNHCPLTKPPDWANNEEKVNLYFNLLYAYEIINSILIGMNRELIDVSSDAEHVLCSYICDCIGRETVGSFSGLLSYISVTHNQIIRNEYSAPVKPSIIGPAFLSTICVLLKEHVPFFSRKNIVFVLDDFSVPKVPAEIQKILLPIIWNPGGGYSFRVTSHSESMVSQDHKGIIYSRNREYAEINLGASYINNMDQEKKLDQIKDCIDDIFRRRFALNPDYVGKSLDEILGIKKELPIAIRIRELTTKKKLHTLRYSGWNTIIRLCSGDISYIVDVLRQILRENPSKFPVSTEAQNREIRRYARSELYKLQDYLVSYCNLYEVASHFGKFSLFKLLNDEVGEEKRPAEYLRVEVQIDGLSPDNKNALAELLRNGIFIDGGFSSAGKGVPARRLIFKKLFTPAFPTTYNSRDTWPMSAKHFAKFVKDPKVYLKDIMSQHGIPPEKQSEELENLILPIY